MSISNSKLEKKPVVTGVMAGVGSGKGSILEMMMNGPTNHKILISIVDEYVEGARPERPNGDENRLWISPELKQRLILEGCIATNTVTPGSIECEKGYGYLYLGKTPSPELLDDIIKHNLGFRKFLPSNFVEDVKLRNSVDSIAKEGFGILIESVAAGAKAVDEAFRKQGYGALWVGMWGTRIEGSVMSQIKRGDVSVKKEYLKEIAVLVDVFINNYRKKVTEFQNPTDFQEWTRTEWSKAEYSELPNYLTDPTDINKFFNVVERAILGYNKEKEDIIRLCQDNEMQVLPVIVTAGLNEIESTIPYLIRRIVSYLEIKMGIVAYLKNENLSFEEMNILNLEVKELDQKIAKIERIFIKNAFTYALERTTDNPRADTREIILSELSEVTGEDVVLAEIDSYNTRLKSINSFKSNRYFNQNKAAALHQTAAEEAFYQSEKNDLGIEANQKIGFLKAVILSENINNHLKSYLINEAKQKIKLWDLDAYSRLKDLTYTDLVNQLDLIDFWDLQQLGQAIKERVEYQEIFSETSNFTTNEIRSKLR
ncbi:MAG: hypothetical protein OHK0017_01790 [Patescibacteria group bacterium]